MRFTVNTSGQPELTVVFEPSGMAVTIREDEYITVEWNGDMGEISYSPDYLIIGSPSLNKTGHTRAWLSNGEPVEIYC